MSTKQLITRIAMAIVIVCGTATTAKAQLGRLLEISFDYQVQPGPGSNQFAVWIENTNGEVVKTIIANNFKYLTDKVEEELSVQTPKDEAQILDIHNLNGMRLVEPQQGSINIIRYTDGTTRKTI